VSLELSDIPRNLKISKPYRRNHFQYFDRMLKAVVAGLCHRRSQRGAMPPPKF